MPKGAKRVPWEPPKSNPLHKRCLASSLLRKRWRQGGGVRHDSSTTRPRRVNDSSTRGSTRISGVPTPLDPPWKQQKSRTRSWKDSTTRTEKEGKHEGKVISHTPYTLLRRVGGYVPNVWKSCSRNTHSGTLTGLGRVARFGGSWPRSAAQPLSSTRGGGQDDVS